MTSVTPDVREGVGTADRVLWACWALWAVLVLARYDRQLWITLRHPLAFAAIVDVAVRQTLYCAAIGGTVFIAASVVVRIWRRVRDALGGAAVPLARLAAAVFTIAWFRGHAALAAALSTVHAPGLPALGEAAARAGIGVCGAALVALAAVALGEVLTGALRLPDASADERRIVGVTLGAGALALLSSGLAFAGVYRPWTVALMIAAALVAGAVTRTRTVRGEFPQPPHGHTSALPRVRSAGLDRAWLCLVFLALSFALVGALAPETEYDALWYHLNFPRLWLQSGRPVDLIQEFPSLYPMTWELVFGAGLAMGGTVAAKLLHYSCLLVLAGTVVMTCRRYAPFCSRYAAVGLLVTAPTMLWEATTAYNDLAIAMFAALACYALARFVETNAGSWLIASGLEFGLAASTKHLGLVVLAAAALVLAWQWRRGRRPFGALTRAVLALAALAIVLPLPWYLRAWHGSGNPFFPELYGVFGGGPAARWDAVANAGLAAFKAHFGLGRGVWAVLGLPWNVTVHSALFGGTFGPLWLMLIPGCLAATRSRRVAAVLAVGTLGYLAVWASAISSFQLRFLVPVASALSLLAGIGWSRLTTNDDQVPASARRIAGVAIVAVACLNLPPFIAWHEADRNGYSGWLTHVMRTPPVAVVTGKESEAQYLTRTVPSYAVWQYANAHLPPGGAVLTFTGGDNLYSRRTRYPDSSVLARPAVWSATSDSDVVTALRTLGIGYVIFDRRLLPELRSHHLPIAGDRFQRACTTLFEDGRYRLCQVPSSQVDRPLAVPRVGRRAPGSPN